MLKFLLTVTVILLISILGYILIINDGKVVIELMDYRIESSFIFLSLAILFFISLFMYLIDAIFWIFSLPTRLIKKIKMSRSRYDLQNLADAYEALEQGDIKKIGGFTNQISFQDQEFKALLPLKLILEAHVAMENNDKTKIEDLTTILKSEKKTQLIGIKLEVENLLKNERFVEATNLLEEEYTKNKKSEWLNSTLFKLYLKLENYDKSLSLFKKISNNLTIESNLIKQMWQGLASKAVLKNKNHQAIEYLENAFQLDKNNWLLKEQQLLLWMKLDDKSKAKELIEELVRNNYPLNWKILISWLYADIQPFKVCKKLEELQILNKNNYNLTLSMAEYALQSSLFELARNYLKDLQQKNCSDLQFYKLMAILEAKTSGQMKDIIGWLER